MKKSVITVKSMIETYVNYGLEESTWEMFYNMRCHNLISNEDWNRFYETCKGWQYDEGIGHTIIDTARDCKVVYKMDEQGFYEKVK